MSWNVSKNFIVVCFLFLAGVFIFTRGLNVHGAEYRDDEIFYFQSTQEMVETGNVLSPTYFGENRFQKPILFYWLILLSYKVFGINWFAARFVAVIFAAGCVCLTWLTAKDLFNRKTANLSAVVLMTIPLFFRHAKNAVPDMPLNFFVILAIYLGIRFVREFSEDTSIKGNNKTRYSVLFFMACALGFMIKGFIPIIVPFLTIIIYCMCTKKTGLLRQLKFHRGLLIILLIVAPWFLYMIKTHGISYFTYMAVNETKDRLVVQTDTNVVFSTIKMFFNHCLFYLRILGTYFAPWCLFLVGAMPLAIVRIHKKPKDGESLMLMIIWFFVVFLFFSMMSFVINHYVLVLTMPFAILISYFLVEEVDKKLFIGKIVTFLQKYVSWFFLAVSFFAFCFILVFLVGAAKWWLAFYGGLFLVVTFFIFRSKKCFMAPLLLGGSILFILTQSSVLNQAGLTSHSTLQKFAGTIHQEMHNREIVIGVGSHDIHEKEFQVYFDQRVIKAATSDEKQTEKKLAQLFASDKIVFCLLTETDFNQHLKENNQRPVRVVQEEYILRRRMYIDKDFFMALVKMDQKTVHDYFMEKVILVQTL